MINRAKLVPFKSNFAYFEAVEEYKLNLGIVRGR